MKNSRVPIAVVLSVFGIGCQPHLPQPAHPAPVGRFPDPNGFVLDLESKEALRQVGTAFPEYPPKARERGEEAHVLVAFLIDGAGDPELPSISLLTPPNYDFDRAVCAYLKHARFVWAEGQATRVLVFLPFEFTIMGGRGPPAQRAWREVEREYDALSRAELVARLEAQRHCR